MEQEWSGRLTALEERVSGGLRRIGALEQGQETLRRLATAVVALASAVTYILTEGRVDAERVKTAADAVQAAADALERAEDGRA